MIDRTEVREATPAEGWIENRGRGEDGPRATICRAGGTHLNP
jgi:hypothetical protein